MKLEFDPTTDAAYFEISSTAVAVTREIEAGVMGDYDAEGHLVGIEVLAIGRRGDDLTSKRAPKVAAPFSRV